MKVVIAAFNQEKAQVGAFSVIVQLHRLIVYTALVRTGQDRTHSSTGPQLPNISAEFPVSQFHNFPFLHPAHSPMSRMSRGSGPPTLSCVELEGGHYSTTLFSTIVMLSCFIGSWIVIRALTGGLVTTDS